MGARSKNTTRGRNSGKKKLGDNNDNNNNNRVDGEAPVEQTIELPGCVQRLMQSQEYGELEEACADISYFALHPKHHANLTRGGVPARLAFIIFQSPMDPNSEGQGCRSVHKGIVYMQIAAAEALRNMLTNSQKDEVLDSLAGANADLSAHLITAVVATWGLVSEAQKVSGPEEWMATHNNDNPAAEQAMEVEVIDENNTAAAEEEAGAAAEGRKNSSTYFTLLRLLEELLQLSSVCMEGNEGVATAFSALQPASVLLSIIEGSMTSAWENVEHGAKYFDSAIENSPDNSLEIQAQRYYKQEESKLLASLACAASDALHTLASDNSTLGAMLSSGMSQQGFLNQVVDSVALRAWWDAQPQDLAEACQPALAAAHALPLAHQCVYYQLLQATLAIQGTLLHAAPSGENIARVLPLVVSMLQRVLPMHLWRQTLPLLVEECSVEEGVRQGSVKVTAARLRCVHGAIRVFNTIVEIICGFNGNSEDDEVAFSRNKLSKMLYDGNALYAFGLLLRDILWFQEDGADVGAAADVMWARDQRLLRGAAEANAEVTGIQYTILSTEVAVWGVASTLLMMIPAQSLGEPARVWRSMIHAVQIRYDLLSAAALTDVEEQQSVQQQDGTKAAYNIATHSPAARHLLWLQLESLTQMLWTLQRKQSKSQGGALQVVDTLQALPSDVDLLVRLSWEMKADAVPSLRQACVGAVGSLCCSLKTEEATMVAARYALAVLSRGGGHGCTDAAASNSNPQLTELCNGVVMASAPTQPAQRQVWLAALSQCDSIVSLRVEAANVLMDLFLDERHDAGVYVPLQVQAGLTQFLAQLRSFLKRRAHVTKEMRKNYKMAVDAEDATQWEEVEENLGGFVAYKASNIR